MSINNFDKILDLPLSVKYLPRWMPGTAFLKTAKDWYQVQRHAAWDPYLWCKENLVRDSSSIFQRTSGTEPFRQNTPKVLMPNLCGIYLQDHDPLTDEEQERLVWSSLTTFEGGLDTVSFKKNRCYLTFDENMKSISTALTFFMCMILNPLIQKKAQKELDSVLGGSRLPTIQDRTQLPYLRAIVAEVYRFCPAVPLGIFTTFDHLKPVFIIKSRCASRS